MALKVDWPVIFGLIFGAPELVDAHVFRKIAILHGVFSKTVHNMRQFFETIDCARFLVKNAFYHS